MFSSLPGPLPTGGHRLRWAQWERRQTPGEEGDAAALSMDLVSLLLGYFLSFWALHWPSADTQASEDGRPTYRPPELPRPGMARATEPLCLGSNPVQRSLPVPLGSFPKGVRAARPEGLRRQRLEGAGLEPVRDS